MTTNYLMVFEVSHFTGRDALCVDCRIYNILSCLTLHHCKTGEINFYALHGMQTQSSDENSVSLSVRQTCDL